MPFTAAWGVIHRAPFGSTREGGWGAGGRGDSYIVCMVAEGQRRGEVRDCGVKGCLLLLSLFSVFLKNTLSC